MCSKRLITLRTKAKDFYNVGKALGLLKGTEYGDEVEMEFEVPDDKKTLEFLVSSPEIIHWDFIEQPKTRGYSVSSTDNTSISVHNEPGEVIFSYTSDEIADKEEEDWRASIKPLMDKYGSEYLTVASILKIVFQFQKFYIKSPGFRFTPAIIEKHVMTTDVEDEYEKFTKLQRNFLDKLIVHLRIECTGEPNAYYDYQYLLNSLRTYWRSGELGKKGAIEILSDIYGVLE